MKYIVTYFIVTMVLTPCPYSPPPVDEFGRTYSSNYTLAIYESPCYKKDTAQIKREFSSRKEADKFILRGKGVYDSTTVAPITGSSNRWGGVRLIAGSPNGELTDFKLDSIPLNTRK